MPVSGSGARLVVNPGVTGEYPPVAIGLPKVATSAEASEPAATHVQRRPLPANIQTLRDQVNLRQRNRTITAASMLTLGTATAASSAVLMCNGISRVFDTSPPSVLALGVIARCFASTLAAHAATELLSIGITRAQRVHTTQRLLAEVNWSDPQLAERVGLEIPAESMLPQQEVILEVEGTRGLGERPAQRAAVQDTRVQDTRAEKAALQDAAEVKKMV